jgi:hypothetical protein
VLFAPTNGAPAHGPVNEATICVAPEYQFSPASASRPPVLLRQDRSQIVMRASVVFADAPRRTLIPTGYAGCAHHGWGIVFTEHVPEGDRSRAKGVELWANGPVQVDSIGWWSGDPRKRTTLP